MGTSGSGVDKNEFHSSSIFESTIKLLIRVKQLFFCFKVNNELKKFSLNCTHNGEKSIWILKGINQVKNGSMGQAILHRPDPGLTKQVAISRCSFQ